MVRRGGSEKVDTKGDMIAQKREVIKEIKKE